MNRLFPTFMIFATLGVSLLPANNVDAAYQLDIDVNRLIVQATSAAGVNTGFTGSNFSGDLRITSTSTSFLAGLSIDGLSQSPQGTLNAFQGVLHFSSGILTGGSFNVTTLTNSTLETYTLQAVPDPIPAINGSAPFDVIGAVGLAQLSGNTFAGVSVSPWALLPASAGYFALTGYSPNSSGLDTSVNFDVTVFTPEPSFAAALLLSFGWGRSNRRTNY
jgi:hypothetical protein